MNLFFIDPTDNIEFVLGNDESHHAIRVLRLRKGESITLADGAGYIYNATISDPSPEGCKIKVTDKRRGDDYRDYSFHIAVSPLKSSDRFEWFVEKAVEIGVDEITPLICHRSVKMAVRRDRLEKIVKAAMKQSLKSKTTIINDPLDFTAFVKSTMSDGIKVIAHCTKGSRADLSEIIEAGRDIVLLTGPEGDFTEEEVDFACRHNFQPVTLGHSRLRSETAAIVSCHTVYLANI